MNCEVCGKPLSPPKKSYCSPQCAKTGSATKSRTKALLDKYGLSLEDYVALLKFQKGKCAICGKVFGITKNLPMVDHSHVSGICRGLLCWTCNHKLLPVSSDNPILLDSAADYLRNPPAVALLGTRIGEKAIIGKTKRRRKRRTPKK